MAYIKISDLPAATSVAGTDEFEINASGTSKKATATQIRDGLASLAANTFAGTQNLADNVLQRPHIQDYSEVATSPTISAGALTLDLESGNVFTVSLNGNVSTLTISNPPASGRAGSFTLIFTADGTARSVTWPGSILWPSGTAPTLTSTNGKRDMFVFATTNAGTNWLAVVAGQNF